MTLTAFIFARGGSKGLPGKNIRPFAGKPLIGWAVEQALAVERIGRVIVSTDSAEIAEAARTHGAEVPFMRPETLAGDLTPEILAWRHALEFLRQTEGTMPETFISVPATSPLRLPEDIDACLDEYARSGADVVLSVAPAHRSPWFNMVKRRPEGGFSLVNDDGRGRRIARRQDAPEVFDITTVAYVARSGYVMQHDDLFSGRVSAAVVPVERTADIDTQLDFEVAELLMKKRLEHG
ncbi:acylneuraminate cytidylyltransferase [Thioclava marina]|uniref:Acylneuraminate cytidylyltransferase n=1 Tax=Thioclava marina TaxID=1915077 RepID=A0ABX3MKE3_9RHOB|nr:acylneuraminate cytidylyltransferase family protein [Thioclava marina]OOY11998.1 acylneuraminate cytidylyltransferase [Thioclava marina]